MMMIMMMPMTTKKIQHGVYGSHDDSNDPDDDDDDDVNGNTLLHDVYGQITHASNPTIKIKVPPLQAQHALSSTCFTRFSFIHSFIHSFIQSGFH